MLSKIFRFSQNKLLLDAMRRSKNYNTKFFNIKVQFHNNNNSNAVSKFAVIVSKKISKKAVIRNKIRRRIYEIVRTQYDFNKSNYFVIRVVNKNVCESDFNEIKQDLLNVFKQIH